MAFGSHLKHEVGTLSIKLLLSVVNAHKALLLLRAHALQLTYHLQAPYNV